MIKFNSKRGFTLLEALVATSILMVAVAAPITIAQKGLSSAVYSKNQMIASYLAQDAIEYIKNKRDENVINNEDWLEGLEDCLNVDCQVDTAVIDGEEIKPFLNSDFLNKDSNGFYGFSGSTKTNFTRKIQIQQLVDSLEVDALVTVTVDWGIDSVVVRTLIYDI